MVTANTSIWLTAGWRKSSLYILSQLQRAIEGAKVAGETLPCVEFSITVGDMADMPVGGYVIVFSNRLGEIELTDHRQHSHNSRFHTPTR